jgi:hypothetical protein
MNEWGISEKDVNKYLYCMKEIKLRIDVISVHLNMQWTTGVVISDNEAVCVHVAEYRIGLQASHDQATILVTGAAHEDAAAQHPRAMAPSRDPDEVRADGQ